MSDPAGISLDRVVQALESVRQRLLRATAALEQAKVEYAVIGGHAVAAWVSRVDKAAVRFTQDVDVLVRRADLEAVKRAMAQAGFVYRHSAGLDLFLDDAGSSPHNAVHLAFAGELVRTHEAAANPDVSERLPTPDGFHIATLEALVRIKLTAWRDKDRTHLRDLIGVGLLDASWLGALSPPLAARLKQLLDTPEG